MSDNTRADLRKLAEAATPGPWARYDSAVRACDAHHTLLMVPLYRTIEDGTRDAAYIAAASPDVVLRLLAVVEAAQAVDRQLSMSACQPDSDDAAALRAAIRNLTHSEDGKA